MFSNKRWFSIWESVIPPVVIVVVCFGLFLFARRIQIKSLSSHPNCRLSTSTQCNHSFMPLDSSLRMCGSCGWAYPCSHGYRIKWLAQITFKKQDSLTGKISSASEKCNSVRCASVSQMGCRSQSLEGMKLNGTLFFFLDLHIVSSQRVRLAGWGKDGTLANP